MLPPKGKSKAASIWSVDSGYASNTLEEDEGSHADFFWDHSSSQQQPSLGSSDLYKVQVEDQLRLQRPDSPTAPVTTKLNVFTAKLGSSSNFLVQTSSAEQECVLCRLWDITNPGENLKCDECSRKAIFLSGNIEPFGFEQIPTLVVPQVEPPDSLPVEDLSSRNTSGRCSACEISAFINQDQTSTCDSCTPETSSPESLSSTSQVKRSSARRPPTKLESHALRCLKKWLRDHSSNPYPDADTKRDLAQQCGITEKQVTTWFTNARARRRVANYTDTTGSGMEEERTQTIKISNMRAVPALDGSGGYQIINSNQSSEMSRQVSNESGQKPSGSSRRGKKKDYSHLGTSPATERNSARLLKPALETIMQDNRAPNMWQCTFCYQSVAPKSWRRHEETQHRPKRKWTCLHTGPLLTIPHPSCSKQTSPTCAFCMLQNPSEEHLHHSHRIQECMSKPEEERTFLRPDHLRQHVKNFHSASLADTVRDLWRRDGGSTRKDGGAELWTCGFCGLEMDTWEKRQSHISGHFKKGATMAEWKCCDAASPDAGTRASRKRPTSSEGRPNVFAKLARNLTGLTTRHQQNLPMCDDTEDCGVGNAQEVKQEEAPLLPDLVFDNFTTGIYGEELHFASGSGTESAEEEALTEEVLGSGVPSGEDVWLGLDEGASTEWKGYSDLLDFW